MPSNNGGHGPWGSPSGSSGPGDRRKPSSRPEPDPWGQRGSGDQPDQNGAERPGPRKPHGDNPFGGGPFPGSGPDLDRLIAQAQAFVRRMMGGGGPPSGGSGGRGPRGPGSFFQGSTPIFFLAVLVVLIWVGTGFYRVQPDEQGVVLRFGAYSYWTPPGLPWHLPWPIESVRLPTVTRINRTEIGYRSGQTDGQGATGQNAGGRSVPAESLMLTGDENIVDIDFAVFWRISNAPDFLFNTASPEALVRAVAESSMREVIGRTPIQPALTQARAQIESDVLKQTQHILDRYKAGVEITQVQLQKVDPPAAVIESFRDVQRANTDAERMRNEAEAYRNDIVPRARGDAARIVAEAEGAKAAAVAQATGETKRFDSVLKAYQASKDVTLRRLYLDTMQDVLSHSQSLVVDDKLKGLVPYLPLNLPSAKPAAPAARPAPSTGAAAQFDSATSSGSRPAPGATLSPDANAGAQP
ncbi:MAG TPA: FtsH protease activity modulator HflK [Rhodopila sp.]|nr:FtsH protease activity modulator HflK [Rhodopila sp.]